MSLFPKMPNNSTFWQKWNVFCVMFTGGCLLASRFYQNSPDVVDSAEILIWIGVAGLTFGFAMQIWRNRRK
jgi:phosphatidylglycerophosphate synthase